MENFLKRISFFLIYLPALIFACQFAYFAGLCEPLNVHIATLGMNYSEVLLLGYLNTSVLILESFNKLVSLTLYLVIFAIIAFVLFVFAVHPSEQKNEINKIFGNYYKVKFIFPLWKIKVLIFLNSFLGVFLIYSCFFIFTILIILHYYKEGKKDLITEYKKIQASTICEYKEGYVSVNDKTTRTKPILCGNNKCYGIDLEKKLIITYLPENYSSPLFLSDSIEKELSK